jgi:hypothetical protein
LLYTDTDSLIYQFYVDDIYKYIKKDLHKFDTSDYPADNVYGIPQANKKVLGLMKDENNGKIMTDFVGLRSKMYTLKLQINSNEKEDKTNELKNKHVSAEQIENLISNMGITKKAKGIKKSAPKKFCFDDYLHCLLNKSKLEVCQNLIRSEKHEVYTIEQTKIALNPHDDKRMVNYYYTDTLPWGFNDHC